MFASWGGRSKGRCRGHNCSSLAISDRLRESIRMRILYVVNGFDPGGAEHGLLTLVESGAFEDHELRVLAFCRGPR